MNPTATGAELIGAFVGLVLTLFVFSYIFGDNLLFRLAAYIFVGVSAGFAAVMVIYNVFLAKLLLPILADPQANLALIPPLLLGTWLLVTKGLLPRLARFGNPVMGYLVGAAAASAVGGVLLGTLFPQVLASNRLFDMAGISDTDWWVHLMTGLFILLGTITTLAYFQFSARPAEGQVEPRGWVTMVGQVGQVFIVITLGVLFAGVYAASLAALIERLSSILDLIRNFVTF